MASFVLCHGGGMGGWAWRFAAPALRRAGHDVHTPTYTGFGERAHLTGRGITSAVHAVDVANVLHYEDITDCVLVGHSYSGVVLPGVKRLAPERIARIVYADAMIAHEGEAPAASLGMMSADQCAGIAALLEKGEGPVGAGVDVQQRAGLKLEPALMPAERQEWMLEHLTDMPLACMVTPVAAGAASLGAGVDYIAVAQTVMKPMHERARALGWRVHAFAGDHAFIVGDPDPFVAFLLGLV